MISKLVPGASEASSKWVGKTKNHGSKKWVGKFPYSIKIRQKSGWAHAYPAHPASTPLYLISNMIFMLKYLYVRMYLVWKQNISNPFEFHSQL